MAAESVTPSIISESSSLSESFCVRVATTFGAGRTVSAPSPNAKPYSLLRWLEAVGC